MIKWIKDQLNYRAKYLAALEDNREATKNALMVLAKYEALTASLPLDHELSTQNYWKDYADRRLLQENQNLRNSIDHVRETYNSLANHWVEGIFRYGVQMYGKWQPMETAPKDKWILATEETGTRVDQVKWVEVPNGEGYNWVTLDSVWHPNVSLQYWMALPEAPVSEWKPGP